MLADLGRAADAQSLAEIEAACGAALQRLTTAFQNAAGDTVRLQKYAEAMGNQSMLAAMGSLLSTILRLKHSTDDDQLLYQMTFISSTVLVK